MSGEFPTLFVESYSVKGKENAGGGSCYVILEEREDTVTIGEFGLTEEMIYITHNDSGDVIFEAATDEKPEIKKPPFRKIFSVEREEVEAMVDSEKYVSGEDIREAWENWSEGDFMHLTINGDEREFEAEDHRLRNYDRREYIRKGT